jgi:hypothetical protein
VRCEEGRKKAKYVEAKNTAPKVSEDQSRLNKELQLRRWAIEDHQERVRIITKTSEVKDGTVYK